MSVLTDVGGGPVSYLLYNAETGELICRRFDEANGERVANVIELATPAAKFALDLATVMRGVGKVRSGSCDYKMAAVGAPPPAKPDDDYKPAIGVALWNPIFGALRLETTASIFRGRVDALIDRSARFDEAARGLIPIILFADRREQFVRWVGKTFWAPIINIVGWVERDRIPAFRATKPTVPLAELLKLGDWSGQDQPAKIGFTRGNDPTTSSW
jgi:hypothetical protein